MNRNRSDLPTAPSFNNQSVQTSVCQKAMNLWNSGVYAADSGESEASINILDVIGYDYWTDGGTTARRIDAALKSIGSNTDVTVNINSPGGDVFEGLAIYNLLRAHSGRVTVRVLGIAASAASFIAMAADEVQIARAGFLMIHNGWTYSVGNRHDMRKTADMLQQIDTVIAEVYAVSSGMDQTELGQMMDAETYITGTEAIEYGMADSYLPSDVIEQNKDTSNQTRAAARIDTALMAQGMTRAERRELIKSLKTGKPSAAETSMSRAADPSTPGATEPKKDDLTRALSVMNSIKI